MIRSNIHDFFKKYHCSSIVAFHLFVVITIYYVLYELGVKNVLPNDRNLIKFDAYWYNKIKDEGYVFVPNKGNTLAFFPLFPLLWGLTSFKPLLISVFNCVIFGVSFVALLRKEKLNYKTLLIILSFPSFIFFAVPYSESLFFLFSTLILLGYKNDSKLLTNIGFFAASMVRSVCVIFLPAIIIFSILHVDRNKSKRERVLECLYSLSASISGFLVAQIYIGLKTDKWFYFIEIQKYWNRAWILPKFPLTTLNPSRVMGIDAIAFIFGVFAIYFVLKWIFIVIDIKVKKQKNEVQLAAKPVLFSALFIAGMTILDTCFTFYTGDSTNIWSLNRHSLCTPFAIIFMVYLIMDKQVILKESFILLAILVLGIYFTGVYQYISGTLFFVFYFSMFIAIKYNNVMSKFFMFYYVFGIFLQVTFFEDFINRLWVG